MFLLAGYAIPMIDDTSNQTQKSPIKGRGAVSNVSGRFEPHARVVVDDGWHLSEDEEGSPKLKLR